MKEPIKGKLEPFFETGTEGVIWSVYEDGGKGYDGLHCLDQGDYLTIFEDENKTKILWEGNVDLEYERNYRPFPMNPKYGQQEVLGFWVRGLQKDIEPDIWATWFFDHLPAELYKSEVGYLYTCKSSIIGGYNWTGKGSQWNTDREPGDFIVKFKNGTYYRYKNVDYETYWAFEDAESKGKYFSSYIKNKFDVEKIELSIPDKPNATIKVGEPVTKYEDHGKDVPNAWPFPVYKKP